MQVSAGTPLGESLDTEEVIIRKMYGYIDESGIPGVGRSENDYLALALVLFGSKEETEKAALDISNLRRELRRKSDREFHASKDSPVVQRSFIKMATGLDFSYIYVSIHKNSLAGYATYENLASRLISEIKKYGISFKSLKMDKNPLLFAEIRKCAKKDEIFLRCKQVKSSSYELVQLADYIACISSRNLKNKIANKDWRKIEEKRLNK